MTIQEISNCITEELIMKRIHQNSVILPALAFVLLLISTPTMARSTTLIEPPSVTIQCVLSSADMSEAIISAGELRGWRAVGTSPGNVELRFIKGNGKHVITVNVGYTKDTFAVFYKDSTNLNYKVKKDGTRVIHPRPIGWLSNLSMDIESKTVVKCAA